MAARALGVVAAALWVWLALTQRAEWPASGLAVLGVSLVACAALRPAWSQLPRLVLAPPRVLFLGVCAGAAAALTAWVAHTALRDQPLSIDAGLYLQQARALAHGHLGMAEPRPAQAFSDRFVLEGPDRRLYGIFPPGWPLAIVAFVWLGRPMWIGPVLAVAMVLAQATLGRAVGRASGSEADGELATRASVLLSLPSVARALETADLLSHAFVAVLATLALAGAIDLHAAPRRPSDGRADVQGGGLEARLKAVGVGACVGWVFAARLLDGLVLGWVIVVVLASGRAGWRSLGWGALGAAPFALLLAIEQHAATGAWAVPTQMLYFERSDWPPTCHRLGLGRDIGCTVEHPGPVARLGADGYCLRAAIATVRERAGALGDDLFGFAPLVLLAFVPVVVSASAADGVLLVFVLALTLSYGLFYYGNARYFGARHLFPAAPSLWLLAARGALAVPHRARRGWMDAAHARGGALATMLFVVVAVAPAPWKARTRAAAEFMDARSDLRRSFARHGVGRGILESRDLTAVASAFDSWKDRSDRFFVLEDGSGLVDLRRAHPDLPVYLSLAGDQIGKLYLSRPEPGLRFELERAWPTFVRPEGLATRQAVYAGASGGQVLLLSHAHPGARVTVPFDVAVGGDYEVRVDGIAGRDEGDYALDLDGVPLPHWRGYAAADEPRRASPQRRTLGAGRHVLVARCIGRDPASVGWRARLDALVGVAVSGDGAPAVNPGP